MAVSTRSLSSQIEIMKQGGEFMKIIHQSVKNILRVGLVSMDINDLVKSYHEKFNLSNEPADNYKFPGYCCISINDCLCHGVPDKTILKAGDIVSVDIFFNYKGYCVDCCRSYVIFNNVVELTTTFKKEESLIRYNENLVKEVIEAANLYLIDNNEIKYSFFGNYIYRTLLSSVYCVSHEYGGHTIGKVIHAGLCISSSLNEEHTIVKEGDTFCIEPIISYNKKGEIHIKTSIVKEWFVMNKSGEKTSHWENTYVMEDKKIIPIT